MGGCWLGPEDGGLKKVACDFEERTPDLRGKLSGAQVRLLDQYLVGNLDLRSVFAGRVVAFGTWKEVVASLEAQVLE